MAKLHDDWTVLPRGPLRELEPGLLTVVGQIPMPFGNFPRRMTVVGLDGGTTALFSPVPLVEEEMRRIEALGQPAWLIIPNHGHRLDARPFRARYPEARIVTAPNALAKVAEAVPAEPAPASLSDTVDLIVVEGVGGMELAMVVRHEGGTSLIVNDVIGNVRNPQGLGAQVMARVTGFGPRPQVPRLIRSMLIDDPRALADRFRSWARIDGLRRLIPSHGEIIESPASELVRLAATLDR